MPRSLTLAKYWLPEVSRLSGSLSKTSPRPGSFPYMNVRLDSKAYSTQTLRHRTCFSRKHGLIPRRSIFTSTAPQQATQVAPTTSPSSPPTPAPQSKPPAPSSSKQSTQSLNSTTGLSDSPPDLNLTEDDPQHVDWTRSFHGLSSQPFNKEAADVLLAPLVEEDIEIKPDGILYLPEIKYRRILNRAFGPGGWGLAPRGESIVTPKTVTREYALVVHGRLVSIARGEQDYFSPDGIPTAAEGCKSNALMRCCKDLGIASELWDPRWIRTFKTKHSREAFVEHAVSKKRTKIWLRKGDMVQYPFKETKLGA